MARYDLGVLHARRSRFAEAIPEFERAIELDPNLYGAWANLGVARAQLARWDEAIEALRKAIALAPEADRRPIEDALAQVERAAGR